MRVNYGGNKRKKEEARRKKQEDKRNRRLNKSHAPENANPEAVEIIPQETTPVTE